MEPLIGSDFVLVLERQSNVIEPMQEAMTAERFDVMAGLDPPPFPGGTLLRFPMLFMGMLWYGLRDRL